MGITAAIAATAGTAYSIDQNEEAKRKAKREADKLEKKQAEEDRKVAEATPFGSMDATKRIAAERLVAARRAGRGRAGTVIQKRAALG